MKEQQDRAGIGRNWPDYEVCEVLGHGTYGQVYKIKREYLGNTTYSALKVIHIPTDDDMRREMESWGMTDEKIKEYYKEVAQDFLKENAVMEKLKGAANIVIIEDCIVEKEEEGNGYTIYIKMELLESLESMMRGYKLGPDDIVTVGKDLCDALIACEQKNVVHRDIKPANVFINSFGTFKLGDFGAAKQMQHTKTSMTQIGTGMYMAPELYRGEASDKRVDIYSLGIMLYRIANQGCFPFVDPDTISPASNQDALLKRLKGEELPLPSQVDEELGKIIVKACAHRTEKRYESARELKEALEKWEVLQKYKGLINLQTADHQDKEVLLPAVKELNVTNAVNMANTFEVIDPAVNDPADDAVDTVEFGVYGNKPIQWTVIKIENNKALLLSKYCLFDKPYNEKWQTITWSKCTLRTWLNKNFYSYAFSEKEKAQIIKTSLKNSDNQTYGTPGGEKTEDKIFLLSSQEAEAYIISDDARKTTYPDGSSSWWWLRSPGYCDIFAAIVRDNGFVDQSGYLIHSKFPGVRPALWVKLN